MTDAPPPRPPFDPRAVAAALAAAAGPDPAPRWRLEVVDALPSTNAEVGRRAREGEPDGLVLVADHQTRGRGRLDRTWETPARSALTLSVLLAPRLPAERWPWAPLLAGLAVVEGLEAVGPAEVRPALKWPNDVLVAPRAGRPGKVAGLLAERVESPRGPLLVVGIGLNVNQTAAELPVEAATSLVAAAGRAPAREALVAAILAALGTRWADLHREGGARRLAADYRSRCLTLGTQVRVHLPGGRRLDGVARAVDDDGALVVVGPDGPVTVAAGDVVHVRPA